MTDRSIDQSMTTELELEVSMQVGCLAREDDTNETTMADRSLVVEFQSLLFCTAEMEVLLVAVVKG